MRGDVSRVRRAGSESQWPRVATARRKCVVVMETGIIIVDHGSRSAESNRVVEDVARLFARHFGDRYAVVEPAHMELAEPSIAAAYERCVARGAAEVVVCPFFLGPGKHWTVDIPRLSAEAAAAHPATTFRVAGTLGADELIVRLLEKRVAESLAVRT